MSLPGGTSKIDTDMFDNVLMHRIAANITNISTNSGHSGTGRLIGSTRLR